MQLNIVIRKRDLQLTATSSSIVKVIESRTVNNQGRKIGSRNLTLLLIHNKGRKIGSRNLTLIHNNGDRKSVSQQGGTGNVGCAGVVSQIHAVFPASSMPVVTVR